MLNRLLRWFDDRLGGTRFTRKALDKVFPDHWSFMLGEVALYCFVILVVTGVFLTFFFHSERGRRRVQRLIRAAAWACTCREAYRSTLQLSFDVRAGWSSARSTTGPRCSSSPRSSLHLCRVFFTGAFRRPREMNWVIGLTMLILAMANGFAGYSLPDDLLSGTGLRIAYSVVLSVPIVGVVARIARVRRRVPRRRRHRHGSTSSTSSSSRPLIATLLAAHVAIVWRQKHTQFRGAAAPRTMWWGAGCGRLTRGALSGCSPSSRQSLAMLGGLVQINPIWLYGPFKPYAVSTAAQPDWYMGWLEGALRLAPRSDSTSSATGCPRSSCLR